MKKFNKKITTIVLTIAMLITAVPMYALANGEFFDEGVEVCSGMEEETNSYLCYYHPEEGIMQPYEDDYTEDSHYMKCNLLSCNYGRYVSHDFSGFNLCVDDHACYYCNYSHSSLGHILQNDYDRSTDAQLEVRCVRGSGGYNALTCSYYETAMHDYEGAEQVFETRHISGGAQIAHYYGTYCNGCYNDCSYFKVSLSYTCTANSLSCDGSCRFQYNNVETECETE